MTRIEARNGIPTLLFQVLVVAVAVAMLVHPMVGQQLIAMVPVGADPYSVAANSTTHKVYVANSYSSTVTVIDENTLSTVTVPVQGSSYIAIDEVTNKIYVSGFWGLTVIDGATNNTNSTNGISGLGQLAVNPVTNKVYVVGGGTSAYVVDGTTLAVTPILVGTYPIGIAVNSVTNKIYVSNNQSSNVTVIDGATNNTSTVSVSRLPSTIAVNSATNKVYVTGESSELTTVVTVIDGATLATTMIDFGQSSIPYPYLGVNQTTNKIYVGLYQGQYTNSVIVIDGVTLGTTTIALGPRSPVGMTIEPVTNKIYILYSDYGASNGLVMIDGATNYAATVITGDIAGNQVGSLAVNPATNRIYIANPTKQNVWVVNGFSPLQFNPVTPCRLVDTRKTGNPILSGSAQSFTLSQLGDCNIPTTAAAYSLNVTVVPPGRLGFLTIWPTGEGQPSVSLMNSLDGRIKANGAIVQAGVNGAVSVYVNNTSDVLLDIDGYFTTPSSSTLQFYPLTPCRIVDTRNTEGPLGGPFLNKDQERDFPILESSCIPSGITPAAYSFNVTAVPNPDGQRLGFLSIWPQGESQPMVSTLNNATGTIVANAAIVPAGTGGGVAVYPNDTTDLLIDINGYFAPPGTGGLSMYTVAPCRVLDTRGIDGDGPPFVGEMTINVAGSPCSPPSSARAYVFNTTVVPPSRLGFLTLWPDGEDRPTASTLNATDGAITSNMAIVPSSDGSIDAYANNLTQLILDISSYFAP